MANQAFAICLVSVLQPGDFRIIGLFVHTPFPSSEVLRCLDVYRATKKSSTECQASTSFASEPTVTPAALLPPAFAYAGNQTTSRGTMAASHQFGVDPERVVREISAGLRSFCMITLEWPHKVVVVQMTSLVLTDAPKLERQVLELATLIESKSCSISPAIKANPHNFVELS
ncbi:hypothetical protein EDB19DRAFT_2030969 [Suillus lakei]|nr:hypothetical protein EDB19DRAFT_2030969 [Suillus lakei]